VNRQQKSEQADRRSVQACRKVGSLTVCATAGSKGRYACRCSHTLLKCFSLRTEAELPVRSCCETVHVLSSTHAARSEQALTCGKKRRWKSGYLLHKQIRHVQSSAFFSAGCSNNLLLLLRSLHADTRGRLTAAVPARQPHAFSLAISNRQPLTISHLQRYQYHNCEQRRSGECKVGINRASVTRPWLLGPQQPQGGPAKHL
jgi:hypothetical protein